MFGTTAGCPVAGPMLLPLHTLTLLIHVSQKLFDFQYARFQIYIFFPNILAMYLSILECFWSAGILTMCIHTYSQLLPLFSLLWLVCLWRPLAIKPTSDRCKNKPNFVCVLSTASLQLMHVLGA